MSRAPRAWDDFVDRFIGLVVHVTNHSAQCRSMRLSTQDREDLCAEVFLAIVRDDFAVLRHFRGQSSLATYLTVVARRVVVRELLRRHAGNGSGKGVVPSGNGPTARVLGGDGAQAEQRVSDREEVARLLGILEGQEATIVRMYHLEGKTYQEISTATGVAENSVGPTLSRARQKMRNRGSASK
ncbi:MAG TPA: sigma-70 family RNA polymerase sigma factor [Pirellulales bacterium]|nr:sigma-70 family RNA polymerase sigma factor [Pirellulales bacterium]